VSNNRLIQIARLRAEALDLERLETAERRERHNRMVFEITKGMGYDELLEFREALDNRIGRQCADDSDE